MELQGRIKKLIDSIGKDHPVFHPTTYATAWVSRVPDYGDLSTPAFPQCLEWLRQHQLPDGSWGTLEPVNPYANTISTLAALLALKHWARPEDHKRVDRALGVLDTLAQGLNNKGHKTFGFELILSSLVEETVAKKIRLSKEVLASYSAFLQMGNSQRDMLKAYQQQSNYQNPNVFWLLLEMLGGHNLTDTNQSWPFPSNVLAKNGSLLSSVPATAYFLTANHYRGTQLPDTFGYLKNIVDSNQGGASPFHPMEQYELAFSLDFLTKGGIPVKLFDQALIQLHNFWSMRNGLGYSIHSPSLDADDTALGIILLKQAGITIDYHPLLEFFNGSYFTHYKEDPTPSVSVNANVLRALQYFNDEPEVKSIINSILNWITSTFESPLEEVFRDIWHLSPYYSAQSIVFALTNLDNKLSQKCSGWLIEQQRDDGGWGYFSRSTLEETALAALALVHQIKQGNQVDSRIIKSAKNYLNTNIISSEKNNFYMGTTMVYPTKVVESTIAAAHYAVNSLSL